MDWETRIAAAKALTSIIKQVPRVYSVPLGYDIKADTCEVKNVLEDEGKLTFDIEHILKSKQNFAYASNEEESQSELSLKDQKKKLNATLGLQFTTSDKHEMITDHDLQPNRSQNLVSVATESVNDESLSARQKNVIRRKERARKRQLETKGDPKSTGSHCINTADFQNECNTVNQSKNRKVEEIGLYTPKADAVDDMIADGELNWGYRWPFTDFTICLFQDLRHPKWEIRHGAATAIREILIHHGRGGGRNSSGSLKNETDPGNVSWLISVAKLLLCLVANDKFADFLSDQVVAPVRETSAMALASVMKLLHSEACNGVIDILLTLLDHSDWQTRHGSMLAIKYILIARPPSESSLNQQYMKLLLPGLIKGLNDPADDVVGSAAVALVPVIDDLLNMQASGLMDNYRDLSVIVDWLWSSLEDMDELSSSTNAILKLLSTILKHSSDKKCTHTGGKPFVFDCKNLDILVKRILPFSYHSSTSVRNSALDTLAALTCQDKMACQFLHATAGPIMKHLFQQALLEHSPKNVAILERLWNLICDKTPLQPLLEASCPLFGSWLNIISQPSSQPLPTHLFVYTHNEEIARQNNQYIGGSGAQNEANNVERDRLIIRARCLGATFLGKLAVFIVKQVPDIDYSNDPITPVEMLVDKILLPTMNNGKSAYKHFVVSLVVSEWCRSYKRYNSEKIEIPESFKVVLSRVLNERANYDETINLQMTLQNEALELLKAMGSLNDPDLHMMKNDGVLGETNLTQDRIRMLATYDIDKVSNGTTKDYIREKQGRIWSDLNELQTNYSSLSNMALASIAGALIDLEAVGDKLNPVIKPIMDSIKAQENVQLQTYSTEKVPKLLELCLKRGLAPVAEKVIKNLTHFAYTHTSVPQHNAQPHLHSSILSMKELKSETSNRLQKGNKDISIDTLKSSEEEKTQKGINLQRRGATNALKLTIKYFGVNLPNCFPTFWKCTIDCFLKGDFLNHEELMNSLQTLEIIVPELAECFQSTLKECLPNLCQLIIHESNEIRHLAAKCFSTLALPSVGLSSSVMLALHDHILPNLDNLENVNFRQGAIEVVYLLTNGLGIDVVSYIVLLIVPVLGRMSDPEEDIRFLASRTFAILVKLIPLANVKKEDFSLDPVLKQKKLANQKFIDELLYPAKNIADFRIPVRINAEFRNYQMEGIKWLAFLNKYNLHGILCDDMGLGKTLQAITIIVSSHFNKRLRDNSFNAQSSARLPSLVICPSTVCFHWKEEIKKFIKERQHLECIVYGQNLSLSTQKRSGNRENQKHRITDLVLNKKCDNLVIVSSYDIVRNDSQFFASLNWNYLVLDEGHAIKNSKTKTARAIKLLKANHRLILTGTPIQNSVLELWSLFDFLMPGFLGSEHHFNKYYGKPILSSRNSKEKGAQEKGALAIESLHRQVLPFIMRRMKEDVLKDLPPKIIQDHYCDLSPLQMQLYAERVKTEKNKDLSIVDNSPPLENHVKQDLLSDPSSENSFETHHVFQTLQYLRKVCNHPKLVLNEQSKLSLQNPALKGLNISNITNAGKLPVLRELLLQCGIGTSNMEEQGDKNTDTTGPEYKHSVVGQHRALIFFQLKSMIDIVEEDLFKVQMTSVTYLRLDGSIPVSERYSIVQRFNHDVTIDVLLLTTSVGGLGLNLTGADTVIFYEHDWNPMKDLQAMDRAHRIGQKKVVNVYRLICRHTIEEKILGIQQFKLKTANTVISADNSSVSSMMSNSDQILERFSEQKESVDQDNIEDISKADKRGIKAIINSLPDLWDINQYDDEYNVSTFEEISHGP